VSCFPFSSSVPGHSSVQSQRKYVLGSTGVKNLGSNPDSLFRIGRIIRLIERGISLLRNLIGADRSIFVVWIEVTDSVFTASDWISSSQAVMKSLC
jgi:hypothetical protein